MQTQRGLVVTDHFCFRILQNFYHCQDQQLTSKPSQGLIISEHLTIEVITWFEIVARTVSTTLATLEQLSTTETNIMAEIHSKVEAAFWGTFPTPRARNIRKQIEMPTIWKEGRNLEVWWRTAKALLIGISLATCETQVSKDAERKNICSYHGLRNKCSGIGQLRSKKLEWALVVCSNGAWTF